MKIYTASRLSSGNKLFPTELSLDDYALTIKHPGVYNSKSQTVYFKNVSSITIDSPLIGFSTITISTNGDGTLVADGFTKKEVNEIKTLIEEGKRR